MTKAQHHGALEALRDICDSAEHARIDARDRYAEQLMGAAERIRLQADAARTRLVQDGTEYLPTAWAVVDACRIALAETRLRIANFRAGRPA